MLGESLIHKFCIDIIMLLWMVLWQFYKNIDKKKNTYWRGTNTVRHRHTI